MRLSSGDRRWGHLPTVDASARLAGTGYDVPEMQHGDGEEVLQQCQHWQEMALPAEELPKHRQPPTWQLLWKVWIDTDAARRPPLLLVHRAVRPYRRLPHRSKSTKIRWSIGSTSFVKFVPLTWSPILSSSVDQATSSPSTRPRLHAESRETHKVDPSGRSGCSVAWISTPEPSSWRILLVYLFTVHLSFKACLVYATVVIVFTGLTTSR